MDFCKTFTKFYKVLQSFTKFYKVLERFYKVLQGCGFVKRYSRWELGGDIAVKFYRVDNGLHGRQDMNSFSNPA